MWVGCGTSRFCVAVDVRIDEAGSRDTMLKKVNYLSMLYPNAGSGFGPS